MLADQNIVSYKKGYMQNFRDIMSSVQDTLTKAGVESDMDFPKIVVVGSQSSGKSSTLEAIMGKEILPKGAGMVTRCPVILHLKNVKGEDSVTFGHSPEKKYTDPKEIQDEIKAETVRNSNDTNGVTSKPIIIYVSSEEVCNLTLVDLPGLIRNTDQNQSGELATAIRKMVVEQITGENCIILAVSAGNVDMANSEALSLAREVDPERKRTVGVITKLDIAGDTTDAVKALNGESFPLKLGYVGVICRSSASKLALKESIEEESTLLRRCKELEPVRERCGIKYLSGKLSNLLMDHLKANVPRIKKIIQTKLVVVKKELESCGEERKDDPRTIIRDTIDSFAEYYRREFTGSEGDKSLNLGAQLSYLLYPLFVEELEKYGALDGITDDDIRTRLKNANPLGFCSLLPDAQFLDLIRQQLKRLQEPCELCLDRVHDMVSTMMQPNEKSPLRFFPRLAARVKELSERYLAELNVTTKKHLKEMFQCERTCITSEDPEVDAFNCIMKSTSQVMQERAIASGPGTTIIKAGFDQIIESRGVIPAPVAAPKEENKAATGLDKPVPKIMPAGQPLSAKERIKVMSIKMYLENYFRVVKKKLTDSVPRTILTFFIEESKSGLFTSVNNGIFKDRGYEDLAAEDEDIVKKRARCKVSVEALDASLRKINSLP